MFVYVMLVICVYSYMYVANQPDHLLARVKVKKKLI